MVYTSSVQYLTMYLNYKVEKALYFNNIYTQYSYNSTQLTLVPDDGFLVKSHNG